MPVWNQFPPGSPEALLHSYTYWGNLNESNVTSTSYRLDFYGNSSSYIIVEGTGFQFYYDDNEEHLYNVGSVSSFTLYTSSGYPIAQVAELNMLPFELLGSLLSTSATTLRNTIDSLAWTFNGTAGADDITAGSNQDSIYGSAGADIIHALGGADVIDGGTGADVMYGGGGNDIYYVDNGGDSVREASGEGLDRVYTTVSFNLSTSASQDEVEMLATANDGGTQSINITGSSIAQTIRGNAGVNTLIGMAGADTLIGLGGNDLYGVDHIGDIVDESIAGSGGTDRVNASISININDTAHFKGAIENAALIGSANLSLTGNGLGNVLTGNAGANVITGWYGNDTLTGGAGSDIFQFNSALNAATNVDRITDMNESGNDTIRLENGIFTTLAAGALAAGAFRIGAAAADADDRIVYNSANGQLIYDANGNAAGGATVFAILDTGLVLTAADFFVV